MRCRTCMCMEFSPNFFDAKYCKNCFHIKDKHTEILNKEDSFRLSDTFTIENLDSKTKDELENEKNKPNNQLNKSIKLDMEKTTSLNPQNMSPIRKINSSSNNSSSMLKKTLTKQLSSSKTETSTTNPPKLTKYTIKPKITPSNEKNGSDNSTNNNDQEDSESNPLKLTPFSSMPSLKSSGDTEVESTVMNSSPIIKNKKQSTNQPKLKDLVNSTSAKLFFRSDVDLIKDFRSKFNSSREDLFESPNSLKKILKSKDTDSILSQKVDVVTKKKSRGSVPIGLIEDNVRTRVKKKYIFFF